MSINKVSQSTYNTITVDTSSIPGGNIVYNNTTTLPKVQISDIGIDMDGDTDIVLGDKSLKAFMDKVEERLNIMVPNEKLESEWQELKELGDKYRKLEQELLEKAKTWNILKK
jgi:hypothetical protein